MNFSGKIGYLVPQFPGQTHIFFWRELLEMERMGVHVQVFSTRMPPKGLISHLWSDEAIERTHYLGRPYLMDLILALWRLPIRNLWAEFRVDGGKILKDLLICAPAAINLLRKCKAHGVNHIHVHSCGRAALVTALARHMGGPPYSLTLHGPLQDYGVGQRMKWRNAAFATIITEKLMAEMRQDMPHDLPERIVVQPMGVDTDALKRIIPYQTCSQAGRINLFSCGRLNIVKGHQDLMQSIAILVARGFDIHLEIAGEDDNGGNGFRHVLEDKIQELGLQDRVSLLGAIDAGAVRDKLFAAHFFALASYSEPLGVAYMEAMACGVPTLGTDAGGVPELIENGITGCLVPPQNPQAMADMIESLIKDPEAANLLGQKGRGHIVENFSSTRGAEVLLAEIESYNLATS